MTNEALTLDIKSSKLYLYLLLSVYFLGMGVVWYYVYSLWLSVFATVLLSVWAWDFYQKNIRLSSSNAIKKIHLENTRLSVENNAGKKTQYPSFYPAYQSRYLVIIYAKGTSIVLFRDALPYQSLSKINRLLNANT